MEYLVTILLAFVNRQLTESVLTRVWKRVNVPKLAVPFVNAAIAGAAILLANATGLLEAAGLADPTWMWYGVLVVLTDFANTIIKRIREVVSGNLPTIDRRSR
jgi:hypothetical protein